MLLFFDIDDPIADTSVDFGEWKYYDDKGNLDKTVVYDNLVQQEFY